MTFYRLTNEEWLMVNEDLKPSEIRVLYHLRTLDPFGDKVLELKVVDIAAQTKLQKGTVSKALKTLDSKGYIDIEITALRVRLTSMKGFPVGNEVSYRKLSCTPGNLAARQETFSHARKPLAPETVSEQEFQISKTLKTYSDSLDKEREAQAEASPVENLVEGTEEDSLKITTAYKEWLRNKAQKLPTPPVLIEQWIASESLKSSNQRQFLQEMRKLPQGTSIPPPQQSRFQIETAIVAALGVGDRSNALARLQGLWQDGQRELVRAMVQEFPQWGFAVSEEGVRDDSG